MVINSIQDRNGGPINITLVADDLNRRLTISDSFEIIVDPVNDAPETYDVSDNIIEDIAQLIFPNFNDIDSQDSFISVEIVQEALYGSVNIQGLAFSYSSNANFVGSDSFTYRVFDGELYSNISSVFITVSPSNDPPEIINIDSQEMDEDSVLEIPGLIL